MTQTSPEQVAFYLRLIHETAEGISREVCLQNKIPAEPTHARELQLVPVFEDGYKASLLSLANKRHDTQIQFPLTPEFSYLQAYFKKYRNAQGRLAHNIVICTSNYCWARFYAAKELMHCFLDDDGLSATNTNALVNDLIESLVSGGFSHHQDCEPQTIVDEIAWIGAIEYLLPSSWLSTISKLHQDLVVKFPQVNAYLHIAQLLRVPEIVLRHRMKNFAQAA